MTSKHNFSLHDDNFWTNAFRLCEELQSEADSDTEEQEKKEEKEAAPSPPTSRPRLCLKSNKDQQQQPPQQQLQQEEEVPAAPELPVTHWNAVKAMRSCSWNLQQTASTPARDSDEDGGASGIWSDDDSNDGSQHHAMNSAVPVIDDKYMEYYEFLADGFDKLLKDVDDHRSGLAEPSWMISAAGDARAELERGDRVSRFARPARRGAPPTPMSSFECGERAGLGCAALKPKLYHHYNPGPEVYSRKVFVGGLPVDVDEEELMATFAPFGHVTIDWPNKSMNGMSALDRNAFPPKGYVFLIFQYEHSVRKLVDACTSEDDKLFYAIAAVASSAGKLVQIRPWKLADADYIVDVNMPINPRRVIFVGGVPRPIRAVELAHIMDKLYGSVVCAGIDTDLEYKYPKGAGRVAFTNEGSFIRAITDRYAQLTHGEQRVRVEMKPYVLDDQPCDECDGTSAARHAPFFCPHLECLQYYCEDCWTELHACPTREHHKPLVKEA